MVQTTENSSFGVFKPVGHLIISFACAEDAAKAAQAMDGIALEPGVDAIRRMGPAEMVDQADRDIERASPLADLGQELNLVRAHRELAQKGHHFLIVHAPDDDLAAQVAEVARRHQAVRAQHYGSFVIEEMIEPPFGLPQVAESPDRGLDPQTPSGEEGEVGATARTADAGDMRPKPR